MKISRKWTSAQQSGQVNENKTNGFPIALQVVLNELVNLLNMVVNIKHTIMRNLWGPFQKIYKVSIQLVLFCIYLFIILSYMGGGISHQSIRYNVPIEGTKQKGFTHIYRNPHSLNELKSTPDPNLKSMKDVIYSAMQRNKNRDFLGKITIKSVVHDGQTTQERELTKYSYGQIFDLAIRTGSYLLQNKMEFNESLHGMKLVGIFSKNRYEWVVADMACMLYGLTIVPLYDTLGIQNLTYCLQHSGITTLFVTAATIKTILGLKGHGNLVNLICFDDLPNDVQKDLQNHKFKVFHFNQVVQFNNILDHKTFKVTGKNCLTFSYTSGTTGPPKGAMLSHENFLAFLAAVAIHEIGGFRQDDSYVSFLPLPHVFQRVVVAAMIYRGCFVAFYSGDILKFKDDVAFIKPTIFVAVPRLYNRIVENVEKTFGEATGIKGCLINNGVSSKLENLRETGDFNAGFYDSMVFSKVKEKFGGRIRIMVTGSAPIKKETYEYMKILMSCPFYEGYGQTQNTAAAFINNSIDPLGGHCGGVAANLQFKLNDIEEMHYTSEDKDEQGRPTPRGQIWLRGPAVFMGYYKDKEKTDQAITPDGWLRTGDVGMMLPGSNAMKIIDRRKNIFKLQQGEYVAAQKVEGIYSKSHLVSQAFLHGQSHHNFAVAIIVANKDEILKLAQKNNIKGTFEQLCKDKNIKMMVCKELDSVAKQSGLMSFQQAKNVYLEPEPFTSKGILSSTMKLQRFAAKKYYAKQIEDMYNEGPLITK